MEMFEDIAKMIVGIAFIVILLGAITVPALGDAPANLVTIGYYTTTYNIALQSAETFSSTLIDNNYTLTVYFKDNATNTNNINVYIRFNATKFYDNNTEYDKIYLEFDKSVYVGTIYVRIVDSGGIQVELVQSFTVNENVTLYNVTYNLQYLRSRLDAVNAKTNNYLVQFEIVIVDDYLIADELYTMIFSLRAFNTTALVNFAVILMFISVVFSIVAKKFKIPDFY